MSQAIEALYSESRKFPPPAAFAAAARVQDRTPWAEADDDLQAFWGRLAREHLTWFREPTTVLDDANPPFYKWFEDGTLNASVNCLDRHVQAGGGVVAEAGAELVLGDYAERAYLDELTGVANRHAYTRHLGRLRQRLDDARLRGGVLEEFGRQRLGDLWVLVDDRLEGRDQRGEVALQIAEEVLGIHYGATSASIDSYAAGRRVDFLRCWPAPSAITRFSSVQYSRALIAWLFLSSGFSGDRSPSARLVSFSFE